MPDDTEKKTNDTGSSLPSMDLMPLSRIGPVALDCAEAIEQQFGEGAQVLTVIVVAEVLAQDKDGRYIDSIEYASSENRRWIQLAMLNEAAARASIHNEARIDEVDEALE